MDGSRRESEKDTRNLGRGATRLGVRGEHISLPLLRIVHSDDTSKSLHRPSTVRVSPTSFPQSRKESHLLRKIHTTQERLNVWEK